MDAPQEPKQMSFIASFFYVMAWMIGVAIGWPITLLLRKSLWAQTILVLAIGGILVGTVYAQANDANTAQKAREDAELNDVTRQNDAITARNEAAKRDWILVNATFNRFVTDDTTGRRFPLFSFDDPVTGTVQNTTLKEVSGVSIDESGVLHRSLWVSRERSEDGGWTYYSSEPSFLWDKPLKDLPTSKEPGRKPFWEAYFVGFTYFWVMKWLFWSAKQARESRAANLAMRAAKQVAQT